MSLFKPNISKILGAVPRGGMPTRPRIGLNFPGSRALAEAMMEENPTALSSGGHGPVWVSRAADLVDEAFAKAAKARRRMTQQELIAALKPLSKRDMEVLRINELFDGNPNPTHEQAVEHIARMTPRFEEAWNAAGGRDGRIVPVPMPHRLTFGPVGVPRVHIGSGDWLSIRYEPQAAMSEAEISSRLGFLYRRGQHSPTSALSSLDGGDLATLWGGTGDNPKRLEALPRPVLESMASALGLRESVWTDSDALARQIRLEMGLRSDGWPSYHQVDNVSLGNRDARMAAFRELVAATFAQLPPPESRTARMEYVLREFDRAALDHYGKGWPGRIMLRDMMTGSEASFPGEATASGTYSSPVLGEGWHDSPSFFSAVVNLGLEPHRSDLAAWVANGTNRYAAEYSRLNNPIQGSPLSDSSSPRREGVWAGHAPKDLPGENPRDMVLYSTPVTPGGRDQGHSGLYGDILNMNTVGHVRMNDVKDADGSVLINPHEFQSDNIQRYPSTGIADPALANAEAEWRAAANDVLSAPFDGAHPSDAPRSNWLARYSGLLKKTDADHSTRPNTPLYMLPVNDDEVIRAAREAGHTGISTRGDARRWLASLKIPSKPLVYGTGPNLPFRENKQFFRAMAERLLRLLGDESDPDVVSKTGRDVSGMIVPNKHRVAGVWGKTTGAMGELPASLAQWVFDGDGTIGLRLRIPGEQRWQRLNNIKRDEDGRLLIDLAANGMGEGPRRGLVPLDEVIRLALPSGMRDQNAALVTATMDAVNAAYPGPNAFEGRVDSDVFTLPGLPGRPGVASDKSYDIYDIGASHMVNTARELGAVIEERPPARSTEHPITIIRPTDAFRGAVRRGLYAKYALPFAAASAAMLAANPDEAEAAPIRFTPARRGLWGRL